MHDFSADSNRRRSAVALITSTALISIVILAHAALTTQSTPSKLHTVRDLSGVSTAELVTLPQTTAVCNELLSRDVSVAHLQQAIEILARSRRTTDVRVLLDLTRNLDDFSPQAELRNLCRLFAALDTPPLQLQQEMTDLADKQYSAATRLVSHAVQLEWPDHNQQMADQLVADPNQIVSVSSLIVSPKSQAVVYECLRPMILGKTRASPEHRRLAMIAGSKLEAVAGQQAVNLIKLVRDRDETEVALQAISQLPAESLPEDQLGVLAAGLIAWMAEQPASTRNSGKASFARELAETLADRLSEQKRTRFRQRIAALLSYPAPVTAESR